MSIREIAIGNEPMMNYTKKTPYFAQLHEAVEALGGAFNAHMHLDRAGTYDRTVELLSEQGVRDGSLFSLAGKHAVIPMVHASDLYDPPKLKARVKSYLETMVEAGTTRADTVIDVTPDRVGLDALKVFQELKEEFAPNLDLQTGAYSPFGFRDDEPHRWDLVKEASHQADFIGLLPERDDTAMYPDHIGFSESCRRAVELAFEQGKKIHIHSDQANHASENGSEMVMDVIEDMGAIRKDEDEPYLWLIHFISPSTYDEPRFQDLLARMAAANVGVICCPSAAISMRQYRPAQSPTFNCIARVLELLAAGIQVRLGTDNVCDITSPMGTPDLMDELFVLTNAIRFYDVPIIAKLTAGKPLDAEEIARVQQHMVEDADQVAKFMDSLTV